MTHAPGALIRVEVTKWGERPHWRFAGVWLGSDEYGEWLGFPAGTHNTRPGFSFDSEVDTVTLVSPGDFWIATFHAPGNWCEVYVDMCTPATWDGNVLRTVDLDLDVIRMAPESPANSPFAPQNQRAAWGQVFVDDEDEFREHQVAYAYPAEVIDSARASCDAVLAAVRGRQAPYDGTHLRWLTVLTSLASTRDGGPPVAARRGGPPSAGSPA